MDKFIKILRVILVLFFLIWIISWSSIRAFKVVEKGGSGLYNKIMVELYNTPYEIRKWFRSKEILPHNAKKIKGIDSLQEIGKTNDLKYIGDSIFLLHTSFVNNTTSEILLQNIKTGEVTRKWTIPLDKVLADIDTIRSIFDKSNLNEKLSEEMKKSFPKKTDEIIIRHQMMLEDGSVIFKVASYGLIYKMNKNSKILWKSNKITHHSLELDDKGNIWACSIDLNNDTANSIGYRDDAILCLDQEGNELYYKSLTDIYLENNLFESTVESTPVGYNWNNRYKDPFHLNDVEPIMNDGTYWKKGDVFLSMRNKSLVALFRPETDKIIMQRQGPWLNQHDIDIENDSIISIFNNNLSFLNDKVKNGNNIALFNFKTNQTNFILNNMSNTKWQGRKSNLSSKDIFVEDTDTGIYYLYDSIGTLRYKFYVPYRPEPKYAQYPGWSRIYLKKGGRFLEE